MAQLAILTGERFERSDHPGRPTDIRDVFPDHAAELLNHMRMAAMACRSAARTELTEACRAFSNDTFVSKAGYADLLVRCLGQILARPPQFYSPGVTAISEDEIWVLRLILTLSVTEGVSAGFLMRSRVPRHLQQTLVDLAGAFRKAFELE